MEVSVETKIHLNRWKPLPFQIPICDALENKGYKKILAIWPRRSGKDYTAFNLCIRQCLKRVGTVFYVLPTFGSARRIIWDAIDNNGFRLLDFVPHEIIESKNEQQMRIRFKNGSVLQLLGSDTYDTTLVGTNAIGIVFSEYALSDERAYQYARPILAANNGFVMFVSTPRGKNHLWALYNIAMANPNEYYVSKLTINDTQHVPIYEIMKDVASGEISEDLLQQEWYTSFDLGVEGSYYSKYIDRMRLKGQIGSIGWESSHKVYTAWDLGVRDSTAIIFFQIIGQTVRIIDCYENSKVGLEHYAKIVNQKEYQYGKHFGPHDIAVMEFGSGLTRIEKARQLGINFTVTPKIGIEDGIEAVRSALSKVWIDQTECKILIRALENYRQEFDVKRKVYSAKPLHDSNSNFADAMRYLAVSLPLCREGSSPEDLNKRYNDAMNGQSHLPAMFRDDNKYGY